MENLKSPSDNTSVIEEPGNRERLVGSPSPSPLTPKKSDSISVKMLVAGIVIGLLVYFANLTGLEGSKINERNLTVGEVTPIDDNNITKSEDQGFVKPTRYIYTKKGGEIVLGIFGTNKEYSLTENKGNFGFVNTISVSPRGSYILYLRLPDEIINDFNENPPYEYHGSGDWELHLVDITDPENIKDTKVSDKRTYGIGDKEDFYKWEKDETYAYFTESYPAKNFRIDVKSKKVSEIAGDIPLGLDSLGILSTGEFIRSEELGPSGDSVLNLRYNLNLYSADGQLKKTLYENFVSAHDELGVLLVNDETVAVAREVFSDDGIGNSTCLVELLDITTQAVKEIERRNCPPDQSYTSYRNLTVSPTGKYLLAVYPEKETSSFLVYNLANGEKKIDVAKRDSWYTGYWWMGNDEILGYIPSGRFSSTENQVYKVNLITSSVEKETALYGKALTKLF